MLYCASKLRVNYIVCVPPAYDWKNLFLKLNTICGRIVSSISEYLKGYVPFDHPMKPNHATKRYTTESNDRAACVQPNNNILDHNCCNKHLIKLIMRAIANES